MKLKHIKIKDFKGINQIESEINFHNVYVVGGNGKNKTSFLDAIWTTLTGDNIPPEPIRKGQTEATIEVELDKYLAIMEFKKSKKTFRLISKDDGTVVDQPRTFFNSLVGIIDFDPNHFFNLSSAKQIEYFCKLTGINVDEIDKQYSELYDERTFVNKTVRQLKDKKNIWFDKTLAELEPIDLKSLFEKKVVESEKINNFNRVSSGIEERRKKVDEINRQILDLNEQIAKLNADIANGIKWIDNPENAPISAEEFANIDNEIGLAEEKNKSILENKEAKRNSEELQIAEQKVVDIEKEMEENRKSKRDLLSKEIDIPGLTFDGEQFLFEGLPFAGNQINTAAQMIAGLRIGKKLLKDVRILRFDGTLIDNDNLEQIKVWANDNDIQLFVELVDRNGGKLEIKIDEQ